MSAEEARPTSAPARPRVLVCAYAISPYLGSEYGMAWNFVSGLSEHYDLTVLYGTSGGRMGNNAEMAEYLGRVGPGRVEYVFVRPSKAVLAFDWLNHNVNTIFFAWSYRLWLRQVLEAGREETRKRKYDLVHQLGTIGFRNPGFLWKLGLPFVWGPVGGSASMSWSLFPLLGRKGRFRHFVRNVTNVYFLRWSSRVRNAARAAAAIFCATRADQENFRRYVGVESSVIRENAIMHRATAPRPTGEHRNFVWAGRVDDQKALRLLVEALGKVERPGKWTLHVVGDGPARGECAALAEARGIGPQVRWYGTVPRPEVLRIMREADVHVITSLMDSNPTVMLEAFQACIPTIALNHCGMGEMITPETGFRIEITSLDRIVDDLAARLVQCIDEPAVVDAMKSRILDVQGEYHWDVNIARTRAIYEGALARG